MTLNDQVIAFIRTYVPYAVGAALAWLFATLAVRLPDELVVALTAFLVVAAQNTYYFILRLLEQFAPWVGVLLGFPKQPEYIGVGDLWGSVVRTGIPTLAGALVFLLGVWLASAFGVTISPDTASGWIVIVIGVLQALYYAAAKAVIQRFPSAGWLLGGVPAPAVYARFR